MSTIFKTWVNFKEEVPQGEINNLPSETQPDEVLTVRQMLERHVRGLPVSGSEQGVYLPEDVGYIPDYRSLDLTEIDELRQQWAQTVQRYNQQEPASAGGTPNTSSPSGGTTPGDDVGDKHQDHDNPPPTTINS